MGLIVLFIFILVPVIEIGVFIQVGGIIGLWSTIGIVILTAFIGTALLKQQGLSTLLTAQQKLNQGQMPAQELFDGACLLFAGALLLTPGFVTDTIGFLLFIPTVRLFLKDHILRFVTLSAKYNKRHTHKSAEFHHTTHNTEEMVIDVEYEEISNDKDKRPKQ